MNQIILFLNTLFRQILHNAASAGILLAEPSGAIGAPSLRFFYSISVALLHIFEVLTKSFSLICTKNLCFQRISNFLFLLSNSLGSLHISLRLFLILFKDSRLFRDQGVCHKSSEVNIGCSGAQVNFADVARIPVLAPVTSLNGLAIHVLSPSQGIAKPR